MAEGDKYLDYRSETLEWTAKPWSISLGAFLETKLRVFNSPCGQQFEAITFKTPGCQQSEKSLSATKNVPMNMTDYIIAVREMGSIAQLQRPWV